MPFSPFSRSRQQKPPEGSVITGYKQQRIAVNPNRMGSGFRTVQVPIYTQIPQAAPPPPPAAAPEPAPATTAPAPAETPAETPAPAAPQQQSAADALGASIAAMQSGFQQQLQQQAAQFAAMQKAQEERMIALQEQMKQSAAAAAAANRPTVAGVKTATGSAGTDMQIARRGLAGAFGRAGMRIQSLNV